MRKTVSLFILLAAVSVSMPTIQAKPDAKKVWKEIVKPCSVSELVGNKVIFLGLSNNVEVGTLLRPRKDQGGYGRASFQNAIDEYNSVQNNPKPIPNAVTGGNFIGCIGQASNQKNLKASVSLLSAVIPFGGELGAALSSATVVNGRVDEVAMYDMDELVMRRIIAALPQNGQVKPSLLLRTTDKKPVWYMVSRAFRVKGLRTQIDFKRDMGVDFKGKYNGPLGGAGVGELGAGLSAKWISNSVMELTSTAPFYIAAELSWYDPTGFAGGSPFKKAKIFTPTKVADEPMQ